MQAAGERTKAANYALGFELGMMTSARFVLVDSDRRRKNEFYGLSEDDFLSYWIDRYRGDYPDFYSPEMARAHQAMTLTEVREGYAASQAYFVRYDSRDGWGHYGYIVHDDGGQPLAQNLDVLRKHLALLDEYRAALVKAIGD